MKRMMDKIFRPVRVTILVLCFFFLWLPALLFGIVFSTFVKIWRMMYGEEKKNFK